MNTINRSALFVALSAVAFAGQIQAQTATDDFQVTAEVVAACSIVAGDLAFGNYNPVTAAAVPGQSTINVTCTNASPYSIGLSAGAGVGATATARLMTHAGGPETLTYGLFIDALFAQNWGTDLADRLADTGTGVNQAHTVYGRVDAGQNLVIAGVYTDTVTATIYF
jgi:spore coat protein U-like protein